MSLENIKVIGFDADDTLWVNETYFRDAEEAFFQLMADYASADELAKELLATEIANLEIYGYGVKAFVLSMLETALHMAGNNLPVHIVGKIIELGRHQLNQPVELLSNTQKVLEKLYRKYKIIVITKGDLLDQERKLQKSGLLDYFHHIEVVSEKKQIEYQRIHRLLDIQPEEFVMIGNSLKSDILPVLECGSYAIHIPFHSTWIHEKVDVVITDPKFYCYEDILDTLHLFNINSSQSTKPYSYE